MKIIKRVSLGGDRYLGVVTVAEWFVNDERFTIYRDFWVVGTWSEFVNTPQPPVIEGKRTIAMIEDARHAQLIYGAVWASQ